MRKLAALLLAAALPVHAMDEVPFIATPDHVTVAMLNLARVGPEDYLMDLGSGDGRIVITAAKRFGARGLDIELSPQLVRESRENARRAGVESRAFFREQDLFQTDLSPASVITMYLLPDVNLALRPRLLKLRPGTRVVSHDWDMGEWQPDKTVRVDVPEKEIGLEKFSRLHLWIVPARIEGLWCGGGKARGVQLEVAQEFQRFRARWVLAAGEPRALEGRIEGTLARVPRQVNLRLEGERLRAQAVDKSFSPFQGAVFTRSRGRDCPAAVAPAPTAGRKGGTSP